MPRFRGEQLQRKKSYDRDEAEGEKALEESHVVRLQRGKGSGLTLRALGRIRIHR
jgi:hypothetical protein